MPTIKYRRATIQLKQNPRKGICECCGRKGKTDLHHWTYEFETKEVKKHKELALKNVNELCFFCHRVANSMRIVESNIYICNKLKEIRCHM